ncbi:hypothetical protein DL96DRAFT_1825336 [Flagelloscypha sp. PMI_526]|nr:hypothetical protein DL96DRAFT_1825336 [Flagelloscypha sp. PMI_526]
MPRAIAENAVHAASPHSTALPNLPLELLFQIFLLLTSASDVPDPQQHGVSVIPIILGQVCRTWRQAVTLSPALWSYLRVHTTSPDPNFIAKFEMCLERSHPHLLDIVVSTGTYGLKQWAPRTTYVFDRLAYYSKRWASMSIHYTGGSYEDNRCLGALQGFRELPYLHTLRLENMPNLPECFVHASSLKTLDAQLCRGFGASQFLSSSTKVFRALETLSIFGYRSTTFDVVEFLRTHPLISSMQIEMVDANQDMFNFPNTITPAPNLASLELKQSCHILCALDCPSLHTLGLTIQGINEDSPSIRGQEDDLPAFLARTPSLRVLKLQPVRPLTWLTDPLLAGSYIDHLDLKFIGGTTALLLACLSPYTLSTPVLSNLTSISLSFRPPDWNHFHFPRVEEFLYLLPRRSASGDIRSSAFPALERVNLSIALWSRPGSLNNDKDMKWYGRWRKIEDMVHPGAMTLRVTAPQEDWRSGVEIYDLGTSADTKEHSIVPKLKKGGRWMKLGSIFR